MDEKVQEILVFWFGGDPKDPRKNAKMWWKKDPELDARIRRLFGEDLEKAVGGEYEHWKNSPEACLAWIILLDQFSRNIFRDRPEAFTQDLKAQEACKSGLKKGLDQKLSPTQKVFFYMPLMHSENLTDQKLSLEVFKMLAEGAPPEDRKSLKGNYDFALSHYKIIESFGRFPHRNKILGRISTPQETEFLKQPGSSF